MHRINGVVLVCLATLPAAARSLAGEIDAASKIDAVIVYPDAAAIARVAEIELPVGATTLVFRNLPLGLNPDSLRLEALGAGGLAFGAVETRTAPAASIVADTAIEAKLKSLREQREATQTQIDSLEIKKAMVQRFAQSSPEKLGADTGPLDVAQWNNAWDAVGLGLQGAGDALRVARGAAHDLDEQIRPLEQARQRPRPQTGASREAIVELDAATAQKARVTLTYRVAGAGWQPVYDARLVTRGAGAKASLELVRRAEVTQRTGEDWTGVKLAVSTVRAQRGVQAPDVQTQLLAFYEPQAVLRRAAAPAAAPMSVAKSAQAERQRADEPPATDAMSPATEQQASLDAGAYSATFEIAGRLDIAADGSRKSVRISTARFTPELMARAAPSLDETAYLQARIVNEEAAPLLPGLVNIVRDGAYVGTGRVALVAPGDSADFGFGADDRIVVKRIPVKRKENEPTWINQTKSEQREFKTTVKNLHDFAVKVNVVDRVPVSESTAIVVDILATTTTPTEKIVNDKRGVMGWTYDIAANETKSITLAYRLKWPADRDIVSQDAPGGVTPYKR